MLIGEGLAVWPAPPAALVIEEGNAVLLDLLKVQAALETSVGLASAVAARRRAAMVGDYLAGVAVRTIGDRFGVTGQRVQQIVAVAGAQRLPPRRCHCAVCGSPVYGRRLCFEHLARLQEFRERRWEWMGLAEVE